MRVLAQDDDGGVAIHCGCNGFGRGGDVFECLDRALTHPVMIEEAGVPQFGERADDPFIHGRRIGIEASGDLERIAAGHGLGQACGGSRDAFGHQTVDAGELLLARKAERGQPGMREMNGIALFPLRFLFARAIAEIAPRAAAGLMQMAVAERLHHDGTAGLADHAACFHHRLANGHDIHSVALDRRDTEHGPAGREPYLSGHLGDVGGNAVEIVLDEENHGQVLRGGDVH